MAGAFHKRRRLGEEAYIPPSERRQSLAFHGKWPDIRLSLTPEDIFARREAEPEFARANSAKKPSA